jgi:outer membrane protein assembly factor BamB
MESRRTFLRATGVAASASLAGCADQVSSFVESDRVDTGGDPPVTQPDTQFRGNLRRHGVYPDATVPEAVTVDWRMPEINTGDHTAAKASAVQAPGGDIVVPGDTAEVRRVTPDGEVVWTAEAGSSSRGVHGTPTIANGAVYIGAYDGAMYAFDLETGEQYWRTDLGGSIGSSPGYYDSTVYIAVEYPTPSGAMYAVDAITGEVEWDDQRVTDHPHSTCAIDRENGYMVVGANDGDLYCWTYPDYEFQWTFETGEPIKGPVAIHDGHAVFGSWDSAVYSVALADGSESWHFDTGGLVMSGPSIEPSTGTVYIGSHDTRMYALEFETGDQRWEFDSDGRFIGCPVVTAGHVLAGSQDDHLYALDKDSGEEVWRARADGQVTSTPLVTDDAVYYTARASGDYLDDGEGPTGALYRLVPA